MCCPLSAQSNEWETVVGGDEQEDESETEANEKKADGSSDGSGVARKSLSGTLESLRLRKSATSLPRKREEVRLSQCPDCHSFHFHFHSMKCTRFLHYIHSTQLATCNGHSTHQRWIAFCSSLLNFTCPRSSVLRQTLSSSQTVRWRGSALPPPAQRDWSLRSLPLPPPLCGEEIIQQVGTATASVLLCISK